MPNNVDLSERAWKLLQDSVVEFRQQPVGTVAAKDPDMAALNYDQVFTRDFAVSAAAFLSREQPEIVCTFLKCALRLQSRDKHMDCFRPSPGLMPASFKVDVESDMLIADFGERAIARVAPVDSGFWWLYVLRQYVQATGDSSLANRDECRRGIQLILELALQKRYEMLPTMLAADGSFTIDRRMGVYGHPLDLQALFFAGLRSARELLPEDHEYQEPISRRLGHLIYHLRTYYWLDSERLNGMCRYSTEQFGKDAENPFNIFPDSIPKWVLDWMPESGGYFVGNIGPSRMDFRFFAQGNLLAIVTSLASRRQSEAILDLFEQRWEDLIGEMPLKICYPPLTGDDWKTVTGADPKNIPWSYHNGGNWPFLLWLLAVAAVKLERPDLARRALETAEKRLDRDDWPEYFEGRLGRSVGREARRRQTWTIAGYLAARDLVASPERLFAFVFEEDADAIACTAEARASEPRALTGANFQQPTANSPAD